MPELKLFCALLTAHGSGRLLQSALVSWTPSQTLSWQLSTRGVGVWIQSLDLEAFGLKTVRLLARSNFLFQKPNFFTFYSSHL